jgi:broad specificity phosphatase PhoE
VPADRVHLVRHGEVFNPDGVLYGRLPGYRLSDLGRQMAAAACDSMADRPIVRLVTSPLQRTHESAEPWAARFGLDPVDDERVIEGANRFEGSRVRRELRRLRNWPYLIAPWRPSWGEPFSRIAGRMMSAVGDAFDSVPGGEVAIVTHQLPIWMVARTVAGKPLAHDPRTRRCSLSSITSLERRDGRVVEVGYQEPAADLLARSIDLGAV